MLKLLHLVSGSEDEPEEEYIEEMSESYITEIDLGSRIGKEVDEEVEEEEVVEEEELVKAGGRTSSEDVASMSQEESVELREIPVAVKEIIRPKETIEEQKVIYRERHHSEIHQVIKPITEKRVLATQIHSEELPEQDLGVTRASEEQYRAEHRPRESSEYELDALQRKVICKPPIVRERVVKKIIREVQPVIYRETIENHLVKRRIPMRERIVEAPKVFQEELETEDLGTVTVENVQLDSRERASRECGVKEQAMVEVSEEEEEEEKRREVEQGEVRTTETELKESLERGGTPTVKTRRAKKRRAQPTKRKRAV